MDSHDLTPDQLRALTERLRPTLAYLNRLLRRMEAEGFPEPGQATADRH